MRVLDLLTAPWAIRPEVLQTMLDVYDRHLRGEKPDVHAIEAAIGRPLKNEPRDYFVQDGVAVLPIEGVLAKRMDLFSEISGGASTQRLQMQLAKALADEQVHSVVLAIDSPGGEVDGVQALAEDVYAARSGPKPIVAVGDGVMASGAYWIASAASKVFITGDTTAVGSIGVIAKHVDVSKAQEMRGVKVTDITAGKYKAIASPNAPLSQEGRQSLQEIVDHIYSVFVNDVGRNRGASPEQVLKNMADGRLYLGQKAVDAGLVDGIATLGKLVSQLNAARGTGTTLALGAAATPSKAAPAALPSPHGAASVEPERADESLLDRFERIKRTAALYVPPQPTCAPPVKLLPPSAPKVEEIDPQQLADRARQLQSILKRHRISISIEEAVRIAAAERSPTLPDPTCISRLAQVEVALGKERRADVPIDIAVQRVRARWSMIANEAV